MGGFASRRGQVYRVVLETRYSLKAEAENLEEILKNTAHPKNLVAVKKSGTPVVSTPSLTAKPQFLASLHDEFELLDFNADWVHVRISGLSRGWIWRNSVEMPEGISDTAASSTRRAQCGSRSVSRGSRGDRALPRRLGTPSRKKRKDHFRPEGRRSGEKCRIQRTVGVRQVSAGEELHRNRGEEVRTRRCRCGVRLRRWRDDRCDSIGSSAMEGGHIDGFGFVA